MELFAHHCTGNIFRSTSYSWREVSDSCCLLLSTVAATAKSRSPAKLCKPQSKMAAPCHMQRAAHHVSTCGSTTAHHCFELPPLAIAFLRLLTSKLLTSKTRLCRETEAANRRYHVAAHGRGYGISAALSASICNAASTAKSEPAAAAAAVTGLSQYSAPSNGAQLPAAQSHEGVMTYRF